MFARFVGKARETCCLNREPNTNWYVHKVCKKTKCTVGQSLSSVPRTQRLSVCSQGISIDRLLPRSSSNISIITVTEVFVFVKSRCSAFGIENLKRYQLHNCMQIHQNNFANARNYLRKVDKMLRKTKKTFCLRRASSSLCSEIFAELFLSDNANPDTVRYIEILKVIKFHIKSYKLKVINKSYKVIKKCYQSYEQKTGILMESTTLPPSSPNRVHNSIS